MFERKTILINGKQCEVDLNGLAFIHKQNGIQKTLFHFDAFSKTEWDFLRRNADLPSYEEIINKMLYSLQNNLILPVHTGKMVGCIYKYLEGIVSNNSHQTIKTQSNPLYQVRDVENTNWPIPIKPCLAGKSYIYNVVNKSDCCFEETHRTKDFVFERIHIHRQIEQRNRPSLKKQKDVIQKPNLMDTVFHTQYFRVVSLKGRTIGFIHVFPSLSGLKELRFNAKTSNRGIENAAIQFIETFGCSYYRRYADCFKWTSEAAYLWAISMDPESAGNPKFQFSHYFLVPGKNLNEINIRQFQTGADCGTMQFNSPGLNVDVTLIGRHIGCFETPAQGLFMLQLQHAKCWFPF